MAQEPQDQLLGAKEIYLPQKKGREQGKGEKRRRERGQEYLSQRGKGLSLDREERDMAHRQVDVYKGKRGCQDEEFSLNWVC